MSEPDRQDGGSRTSLARFFVLPVDLACLDVRPEVGVVAQHLQARILEQGLHRVAGRTEGAQRLVQRASAWLVRDGADRGYWSWMQRSFGLREPHREGRAAPTSEAGPARA